MYTYFASSGFSRKIKSLVCPTCYKSSCDKIYAVIMLTHFSPETPKNISEDLCFNTSAMETSILSLTYT